jgi:hypothetical protein
MKWLLRLTGRAAPKTPMPPKPYVDTASTGRHMVDQRYYDMNDLKNIDAEKPHWEDPRFESREKVPFFDFFGFNRNWSWSLFKFMSLIFVGVFYYEVRTLLYDSADMRVTTASTVSPVPGYARDVKATEEELRSAGFAYVGTKDLDHLDALRRKTP